MLFSESTLLFLFNLAVASLLCAGVTVCMGCCFRALPKRHATLVVGLAACVSAVAIVGIGSLFSLGQFSSNSGRNSERLGSSAWTQKMEDNSQSQPDPVLKPSHDEPIIEPTLQVAQPQSAGVSFENDLAQLVAIVTTNDGSIAKEASTPVTSKATASSRATLPELGSLLACVWLVGFLSFFALRILDWYRCRHLIRTSRLNDHQNLEAVYALVAKQLQLRRNPRLLVSDGLPAPIAVGVIQPTVIVPADIDQLFSAQQLRSVLVHELSHVARKDHWVVGLQILATTLYWWNPLVWLISNKVAEVRELICDDIAVRTRNIPREYAQSIIAMAERVVCQTEMLAPLGISRSSAGELERRIRRIISNRSAALQTQLSRWSLAGVSLFAAVLVTGLLFAQVPSENAHGMQTGESEMLEQTGVLKVSNKFGQPDEPANRISGQVVGINGQPASEAIVRITGDKRNEIDATIVTDTTGRFDVTMHLRRGYFRSLRFWAESKSGNEIAFHRFDSYLKDMVPENIEIKLETARTAEIDVVDADGQPIADAQAVFRLKQPYLLHGYKTNDTGRVSVKLPASERIEQVAAWKDHAGFDYRIYALSRTGKADINAVVPEFPADKPERLILDGTTPFAVQFVDDANESIKGVEVYPWILKKEGAPDIFNLAFFEELFIKETDAEGVANFNWMPAWQKQAISVFPNPKGYVNQRGDYDPLTGDGTLRLQFNRRVSIRGKVLDAGNNPVGGVEVNASTLGSRNNAINYSERTNDAGEYELFVMPNKNYLLTARNVDSVAAALTGVLVFPSQPLKERNFQLRKPTRVHGRLLDKHTQKPIPDKRVEVHQLGTGLANLTEGERTNSDTDRTWSKPRFVHEATTDTQGEFEFRLGDGNFIIEPRSRDAEEFKIHGQDELEFTVMRKVQTKIVRNEIELHGRVTAKSDGRPIGDAKVSGLSRVFSGRDWEANTDSNGEFDVLRLSEPTYAHFANADQTLAAIAKISDTQQKIEIQLEPVGSAFGRLMDGDKPIANQIIRYGVKVPNEKNTGWSLSFGGTVTTDSEGKFGLKSLTPNWEYSLDFPSTSEGYIPHLADATVKSGESKDLGGLKKPAPRYVPPTFEERVASAFNVKGTPLERYERALVKTQLVHQHLLAVFGQPDNPSIRSLMDIRYNDKEFRPLRDDYLFMAIPTDETRLEKAKELAKRLHVDFTKDQQKFYLVILNVDGQTVATAGLDELTTDSKLSKEKLFELLGQHQTEAIDARQLLDKALKRAAKENKRVLVQETATWCPPCHQLNRLLDSNRVWEKDYVWVKMDHRWKGARKIMKKIRGGAKGGIPWFAILDAQGKKLTTSDDPKTGDNIGYPSGEKGQAHFAKMLNDTRQRMSESDVESLVDSIGSTK